MSTRHPSSLPPWARKFRAPVERAAFGNDPQQHNRQSITVGVVATVLVHLAFFFVGRSVIHADTSITPRAAEEVELELPDLSVPEEEDTDAPRYVETNPDAPENEPDKTANESDRNQQAANEKTPDGLSPDRTPARDGEKDIDSDKIVPGSLDPAIPVLPSAPDSPPQPEVAPSQPAAHDPLPGTEDDTGDSPEGIGTKVAPPTDRPEDVEKNVAGDNAAEAEQRPAVRASPGGTQRPQPAPRPKVTRLPPGPIEEQLTGVSQTGYVGVDARFSQFGEYMTRMREIIQLRWDALCSSRSYGEHGTLVVLRFRLTSDGRIWNLQTLDSSAQEVGTLLCRTAIEQGQPYGVWTEEMVRVLGDDDIVTFRFRYW